MQDYIQNYNDISFPELSKIIQNLATMGNDQKITMQLASALGVYMYKLQEEYKYPPVFPLELLPLPKTEIKKWGFNYASLVVKNERILKQFQQDAALCYTRFQQISSDQWDAIGSESVDNLLLYNAEIRDNGSSSLPISHEFKTLIDSYQANYNNEVVELHEYLRSAKSKPFGCIIIAIILLVVNLTITWLFIK